MLRRHGKKLITVSILIIGLGLAIYAIRSVQEWFEYDFDMPGPDCLMNTWMISGTVKSEQGLPVPNAHISIIGHDLACDNAIRFQPITTGTSGSFEVGQTIYSPVFDTSEQHPDVTKNLVALNGKYEITVDADGYQTYHKVNATDNDIFGGMTITLKKR